MNQDRPRMAVLVTADMLPRITQEQLQAYDNCGIEVRGVDVSAERVTVKPLHPEHSAWFTNRKRQAQWKQERARVGRGRLR